MSEPTASADGEAMPAEGHKPAAPFSACSEPRQRSPSARNGCARRLAGKRPPLSIPTPNCCAMQSAIEADRREPRRAARRPRAAEGATPRRRTGQSRTRLASRPMTPSFWRWWPRSCA